MTNPKTKSNYTRGSIGGTMLKTGFAMLAGTLAMSGYNIVDTYFVGNLGKIPMAAMGFTMPIIMLVGCFFRGLTIGVMATSAQSLGGGRYSKANTLIFSGLALITIISLIAGICGLFVSEYLIRLMNASAAALPMAKEYMDIWFLGCVTAFVGLTGNDLLISSGYSRTAAGSGGRQCSPPGTGVCRTGVERNGILPGGQTSYGSEITCA